jgi:hypothetical protein
VDGGFVDVALDLELDPDLAVTAPHLGIEIEEPVQIEVALELARDVFDFVAASGRVIGQRGGHAARESGEDELDRVGALIFAEQHGRLVGVEDESLFTFDFLAGAVEAVDGGLVVAALDPLVAGAELEFGQFGLLLDGLDGLAEFGHVDAVEHRFLHWVVVMVLTFSMDGCFVQDPRSEPFRRGRETYCRMDASRGNVHAGRWTAMVLCRTLVRFARDREFS